MSTPLIPETYSAPFTTLVSPSDLFTLFSPDELLRKACEKGLVSIVAICLDHHDCNPTANNSQCLRLAAENGYFEIVKLLLEDGRADPTAYDSDCLQLAAKYGHHGVVKLLLEDGRADPTANDSYCRRLAAVNGHLEVVKLLLEDGRVDPTALNSYCLQVAATYGHHEVVELIEKHIRKKESKTIVENRVIQCAKKAMEKESPKVVVSLWSRHAKDLEPIQEDIIEWCLEHDYEELLLEVLGASLRKRRKAEE